jgi:hypothetical protein
MISEQLPARVRAMHWKAEAKEEVPQVSHHEWRPDCDPGTSRGRHRHGGVVVVVADTVASGPAGPSRAQRATGLKPGDPGSGAIIRWSGSA